MVAPKNIASKYLTALVIQVLIFGSLKIDACLNIADVDCTPAGSAAGTDVRLVAPKNAPVKLPQVVPQLLTLVRYCAPVHEVVDELLKTTASAAVFGYITCTR